MTNATLSIQDLRDIVVPDPVGVWPTSTAAWVLLCLLGVSVLVLVWQLTLRWQANAYRRSALRELNPLSPDPTGLPHVLEILKRTALAAFPRSEVASLSGSQWVKWLNSAAGRGPFTGPAADLLATAIYRRERPSEQDLTLLIEQARNWIRTHKPGASAR